MSNKFLKSLNFGTSDNYFPLPIVSTSDNSKILQVQNGEWVAISPPQVKNGEFAWMKFTSEGGDFVEFVISTLENAFPEKGLQDGYWYELVASSSPIYGVSIDLSNSNPETSCTYTDDAVGITPASTDWDATDIFKDIKPCLFKNGQVVGYLNPNDYTKFVDGSSADITSGSAGDVMVEIPKLGYKITTEGNTLTVQVTRDPNKGADGFKYYAHTRDVEGDRDYIYVGAYKGYYDGSKLRSLSGKTPTVSQNISTFRGYAQANGSGYDMTTFYALTLLQCLFIIRYKNLNSQTALGQGYTNSNNPFSKTTGGTNTRGMYYGESNGTDHVKCFGIEDLWGNIHEWIEGLYCDSSRNILTAFKNFNNTGSGYTNHGQGATSNIGGYMSKPQGTSEAGFILKEKSGSTSTYFSDYATLYAGYLPIFGGHWDNGGGAGLFSLNVSCSASNANSGLGARVLYV